MEYKRIFKLWMRVEASVNGECRYCKFIVINSEYGWPLNKYGAYKALRRK